MNGIDMTRIAKLILLCLAASSLLVASCARRHAAAPATTVPDYVQYGK